MEWRLAHRNLTEDEIRDLPFELKICFYLAPWNTAASGKITSVDKWSGVMGAGFCCEGEEIEDGCNRAKKKAWELINFLKKYGWNQWTK